MNKKCPVCSDVIVEELLVHSDHIDVTNFDSTEKWYYLSRCANNHFSKSDKKVTLEVVKKYERHVKVV